jgi:membrane protein implicated in regulation of membrane protease activity
MELLENVFLGMFLVGFLFTVLSAVMSGAFGHAFGEGSAFDAHGAHIGHMGGDVHPVAGEGHAEVGWAQHNLATFSPLSPTTISAFLAAAGGAGFLCLHSWGVGLWGAILAAALSGLLFAALVFLGIAWMFRVTQGSSIVSQSSLVGIEGEVSIPIPQGGAGEVAYVRAGQRCVMSARCADAAAVPQGAKVVVKSVSTGALIVEETRESWLARTRGRGAAASS